MHFLNFFTISWVLCFFTEVTIVAGEKYVATNPGPTLEFMNLMKKCRDYFGGETTKINLLASEKEQEFLDQLGDTNRALYVFVWSPTAFTVDEYEKRVDEFTNYVEGRTAYSKIDMFPLFVGQAKSVRERINHHLQLRASGENGAFAKQDPGTRLAIDEPNKRVYFDNVLNQVFMTRVETNTLEEAQMTEQFLLYLFTFPCNIVSTQCRLTVFDRKDVNNKGKIMQEYGTVRQSIKSIYNYVRMFPQVDPYRDFLDNLFS